MIKIGIVGLGPIGSMHAENLKSGKIPNAVLHCACEQKPVDESKYPGVKILRTLPICSQMAEWTP